MIGVRPLSDRPLSVQSMRSWIWIWAIVPTVALVSTSLATAQTSSTAKGMVSADNATAARVGAQILADGGDAADAAVATALALGVVHAFGSGIGGGGFAVSSRVNGERLALDFREVAPAAAHRDLFIG